MFHKLKINKNIVVWLASSVIFLYFHDGYLASFSAITKEFSTSNYHFQISVSIFLTGLGLSQLIFGIAYDFYKNKKRLLIIGHIILLSGALIPLISLSNQSFFLGRFLQGIGVGSSVALRYAIVVNDFEKIRFSQTISYMNIVFGLLQPATVFLWAFIQFFYGWRANFTFISLIIILFLLSLSLFYDDAMEKCEQKQFNIRRFIKVYSPLLQAKFSLAVLTTIFIKFIIYICMITCPMLFQGIFKLSVIEYGFFNLINIVIMIVGSGVNVFFVKVLGVTKMLIIGIITILFSSIAILTFNCLKIFSMISLVLPILFILLGGKIAYNNAIVLVYNNFFDKVGMVGSIYASIEMFICSFLSLGILVLNTKNIQLYFGALFFLLSLIVLGSLFFGCKLKYNKVNKLIDDDA